jgi:RNA recognition motif-containing protein
LEVVRVTKLFVGNLPFSANDAALEALFEQAGTVASAEILTDKFTGRSRGFGFVEMEHDQEAQDAIARLHGYEFQGRALTVNVAKPREDRGGERRGGFGGERRSGFGGGRKCGGHGGRGWGSAGAGRDRRW